MTSTDASAPAPLSASVSVPVSETAGPAPEPAALHTPVLAWFDRHARDLPWRRPEAGAWGVMVSEFMLQQTPVVRVLPVYEQWLARWPRPADLAADAPGEAVRAWARRMSSPATCTTAASPASTTTTPAGRRRCWNRSRTEACPRGCLTIPRGTRSGVRCVRSQGAGEPS